MTPRPNPSLFARIIGVGIILLAEGAQFPVDTAHVYWPGVFGGLFVLFGYDFWPSKKD